MSGQWVRIRPPLLRCSTPISPPPPRSCGQSYKCAPCKRARLPWKLCAEFARCGASLFGHCSFERRRQGGGVPCGPRADESAGCRYRLHSPSSLRQGRRDSPRSLPLWAPEAPSPPLKTCCCLRNTLLSSRSFARRLFLAGVKGAQDVSVLTCVRFGAASFQGMIHPKVEPSPVGWRQWAKSVSIKASVDLHSFSPLVFSVTIDAPLCINLFVRCRFKLGSLFETVIYCDLLVFSLFAVHSHTISWRIALWPHWKFNGLFPTLIGSSWIQVSLGSSCNRCIIKRESWGAFVFVFAPLAWFTSHWAFNKYHSAHHTFLWS